MNLDELIERLKLQTTTESEVRRADLIREVIYKRVEEMLVWGKVIPTVNMPKPDLRFEFPSRIDVAGPIAPEAEAPSEVITWSHVDVSLYDKYEGRFVITDMARAREQAANEQYRLGVRRLAESMAKKEDEEIQTAVLAAAGNTVAATATWDSDTADPAGDMIKAIRAVLSADDVTLDDMKNIVFVLPVNAYTEIMKLQEIHNIRTSLAQWMQETYGVKFLPTKTLDTDAVCLIGGADTGRHYVFRPPDVPLVEERRIPGVGQEYIVRRFFKTWIIPDSADVSTSSKICKITDVWSS